MTDPDPGTSTEGRRTPVTLPINTEGRGPFLHDGDWNSFQFDPPLTHADALVISDRAEEMGYRMRFRRADYSLEEVQVRLVDEGPSAFLDQVWLQEDISPKEPPATAEQRMAQRLQKLAPTAELIITDPFLFTSSRRRDPLVYAESVAAVLGPALREGLHITAVVQGAASHGDVREAVEAALHTRCGGLTITVVESDDFHDRFWIADRARGLIVGTSLNKIGGKIFFVDELAEGDVVAVLREVDRLLAP